MNEYAIVWNRYWRLALAYVFCMLVIADKVCHNFYLHIALMFGFGCVIISLITRIRSWLHLSKKDNLENIHPNEKRIHLHKKRIKRDIVWLVTALTVFFISGMIKADCMQPTVIYVHLKDTLNVNDVPLIARTLGRMEHMDSVFLANLKPGNGPLPGSDTSKLLLQQVDSIAQKTRKELLDTIGRMIKAMPVIPPKSPISDRNIILDICCRVIAFISMVVAIILIIRWKKNTDAKPINKALKIAAAIGMALMANIADGLFQNHFDTKLFENPVFNIDLGWHSINDNIVSGSEYPPIERKANTIIIKPFVPGFSRQEKQDSIEAMDTLLAFAQNNYSEIYIYGGVDKREPKNKACEKYGDNLSLAQARADTVETILHNVLAAHGDSPIFFTSVNGANRYSEKYDSALYADNRCVRIIGILKK